MTPGGGGVPVIEVLLDLPPATIEGVMREEIMYDWTFHGIRYAMQDALFTGVTSCVPCYMYRRETVKLTQFVCDSSTHRGLAIKIYPEVSKHAHGNTEPILLERRYYTAFELMALISFL